MVEVSQIANKKIIYKEFFTQKWHVTRHKFQARSNKYIHFRVQIYLFYGKFPVEKPFITFDINKARLEYDVRSYRRIKLSYQFLYLAEF